MKPAEASARVSETHAVREPFVRRGVRGGHGVGLAPLRAAAARMTRRNNDTDPSAAGFDPTDPGAPRFDPTDPGAPPEGTDQTPVPPIPYEPPAAVRELGQLQTSRAPMPVQLRTTEGDLSAQYHGEIHAPVVAQKTPAPQPSVLLNCTADLPLRVSQSTEPVQPVRAAQAPTITRVLPDRRRRNRVRKAVMIAAAFMGLAGVLAGSILFGLTWLRQPRPAVAAAPSISPVSASIASPAPNSPASVASSAPSLSSPAPGSDKGARAAPPSSSPSPKRNQEAPNVSKKPSQPSRAIIEGEGL